MTKEWVEKQEHAAMKQFPTQSTGIVKLDLDGGESVLIACHLNYNGEPLYGNSVPIIIKFYSGQKLWVDSITFDPEKDSFWGPDGYLIDWESIRALSPAYC